MNIPTTLPIESTEPKPVIQTEVTEQTLGWLNIVVITGLGHFLCHLAETVYGGAIVAVRNEFGLTDQAAASLVTPGLMLLGLGALPVGIWADKWGSVQVFRIYFLVMMVAAILVALTPNVWLLLVTLTLLGFAASIYHPVGLAMISLGVKNKGRAMGINGMAGSVGIALGPALGTWFREPGEWRWAYVVVAVVSLAAFLYFEAVIRRAKRNIANQPPDRKTQISEPVAADLPAATRKAAWKKMLPLIFVYAAMVFGGLNYRILMTSLPTYVTGENASGSELHAGAFKVFLALLVGGIGQYLGGWLADRFGARFVYPILILTVIPMGIVVGLAGGSSMVTLFACFLAISMFGLQPIENSVIADQTSKNRRGLSYASKFTLAFGIGALGTPIAGLIWGHYDSFAPAFYFISGSAVIMAVLATAALYLRQKESAAAG